MDRQGRREWLITAMLSLTALANCQPVFGQNSWIHGRVFFADDDGAVVKFCDIVQAAELYLSIGEPIADCPKLDATKIELSCLAANSGYAVVGVRSKEGGAGGWILIESGVAEEPHGNHSHWAYPRKPRVVGYDLGSAVNPVECVVHDSQFYLVGHQARSWIRIDARKAPSARDADAVKRLATVHASEKGAGRTWISNGFAAWTSSGNSPIEFGAIAPDGTIGQVKNTTIPNGNATSVVVHGGQIFIGTDKDVYATTLTGAQSPANGLNLQLKEETLGPLSAGTSGVAVVKSAEGSAGLVVINPGRSPMTVTSVPLSVVKGAHVTTPRWIQTRRSPPMVVLFVDQPEVSKELDQMIWIEADPNYDGEFRDAKVRKIMDIAQSKVIGDRGHHDIVMNYDRRYGVFGNSGAGSLSLVDLEKMANSSFLMGGRPGRLAIIGGRSGGHHD